MPRSAPAVVVHDVPEGITVAGNPARVISRKQRGRYMRNRWPNPMADPVAGTDQREFGQQGFRAGA